MVQAISKEFEKDEQWHRFSDLAGAYYEPVYSFIARQSPNATDAADITQKTFISAYRSFGRFDPERDFAPWIYRIARRSVANFYRKRPHESDMLDESVVDPAPDPGEVAAREDGKDNLWILARGLKPKYNQILLLHYKENFNLKETAGIMGITGTHAKVLLFRARAALKRRIESTQHIGR